MKKTDEYFKQIKQAATDGKLVFFVGAGVSAISGYPGWTRLVQEFEIGIDKQRVDERKKHIADFPDCPFQGYSSDEFLKIPQRFFTTKGKSLYNRILDDFFSAEYESNDIHEMMLQLNPAHFITTNYDKLIEKSCVKALKNYSSISSDKDVAKASSNSYILKVHGEFKDVIDGKDVVLKEDDYIDYDSNYPLINNLAKSLVATNTVVFIGYGLNDYNINQMLNWVKRIQKNDFKHYFVRVDHKQLKAPERKYYENKGMNIIDVTTLIKSGKYDYEKRYKYFMDRLLNENKWDKINDLKSSLLYISNKLAELAPLSYMRRVDLKVLFDGDYYFYPSGKFHKSQTCKYDYFKEYFDYKNGKERNQAFDQIVNGIDQELLRLGIGELLDWETENEDVNRSILRRQVYSSNNLVFENQYEEINTKLMKNILSEEERLQWGFYKASIGEWEDAYEAFTEVISSSYKNSNWTTYFWGQLNRYFLSRLVSVINRQLESVYSRIVLGRTYQVFTKDFLDVVEKESTYQLPSLVFNGMPSAFRIKYPYLKWLCDEISFSSETSELSKLQFSCSKKIRQNSLFISNDNDLTALSTRMRDDVKFCFNNFVWVYPSSEFKGMVHIALTPLFEHIRKSQENNKTVSFFGDAFQVPDNEYYIDYFEFICMVKCYNLRELQQTLTGIRLKDVRFDEINRIEGYIIRTLKHFTSISNSGSEGIQVISYVLLSEEIKNILYLVSNFRLSKDVFEYVVDFILNVAYERDLNIGDRSFYIQKLLMNNEYNDQVINLIDDFLMDKYYARADERYKEFTNRSNTYQELARVLKEKDKGYYHSRLSKEISEDHQAVYTQKQIDFLFVNLGILTQEAKLNLVLLKKEYSLSEIVDLLDQGVLHEMSNANNYIINATREVVSKIVENKQKGIRTIPEPTIRYTGILHLVGTIGKEDIEEFLGYCDEFDMLVDPENFDFEHKLDWNWFMFYSIKVLELIFDNSFIYNRIKPLLKKKIMKDYDEQLIQIYMTYCTD